MVRFDAYSATTFAARPVDVLGSMTELFSEFRDLKVTQGRGHHRFAERLAVKEEGHEVMAIQWGGAHGDRLMFEVKGEWTPKAVEAFRRDFPHRVTRMDACADFDAPGAFLGLYGACMEIKKRFRLKGSKGGDWEDFPEEGRTLYLGGQQSRVRVRLYEKGKQKEYLHLQKPDWTRIEAQVRPMTHEQKEAYSLISPSDAWGASAWTRELAAAVLKEHIDPHPVGTVYRRSERDSSLSWMCRQYGHHIVSLYHDLGSWEVLGLTLGEMIKEERRFKRG